MSVIIPVCNGAAWLRRLFAMLSRQTIVPDEVLVVDSSSEDDSATIARESGAKVSIIPRLHFDHGATRTMMVKQACGDIVIFLTQDAIPCAPDALEKLVQPLLKDQKIAAVYGRQVPAEDATAAAAHLRLFNYPPHSSVRSFSDRKQFGIQTIFLSNSFAAYRKSALEAIGYFKKGLIFGEDTCAAGRLLQQGDHVAYAAEATVIHSHNYSCIEEFRRSFDTGVFHASEHWLLETYGGAEGRGWQYVRSGLAYLMGVGKAVEVPGFIWRVGLKYAGYFCGRRFRLLPSWLRPLLGMNRLWWKKNCVVDV